jgi:hypothetical protein
MLTLLPFTTIAERDARIVVGPPSQVEREGGSAAERRRRRPRDEAPPRVRGLIVRKRGEDEPSPSTASAPAFAGSGSFGSAVAAATEGDAGDVTLDPVGSAGYVAVRSDEPSDLDAKGLTKRLEASGG